jgi:hypothetical protein
MLPFRSFTRARFGQRKSPAGCAGLSVVLLILIIPVWAKLNGTYFANVFSQIHDFGLDKVLRPPPRVCGYINTEILRRAQGDTLKLDDTPE